MDYKTHAEQAARFDAAVKADEARRAARIAATEAKLLANGETPEVARLAAEVDAMPRSVFVSEHYECCRTTFTSTTDHDRTPAMMHADHHNAAFERGRRDERIELEPVAEARAARVQRYEAALEPASPLEGHTRSIVAKARNGAVLCTAFADERTIGEALRLIVEQLDGSLVEYADLFTDAGELVAEWREGRGGLILFGRFAR